MFVPSFDSVSAHMRSGAVLTVDLGALAENYRTLVALAAPASCAAVVKADAYGLGIARVAPALASAGCRVFFVAHVDEGIRLREILSGGAWIGVLHGSPRGAETAFVESDLVPVLNDESQLHNWRSLARTMAVPLPAILQVDTGMARFGFAPEEFERLCADPTSFEGIDLRLVMSHLACADDPGNAANEAQRRAFDAVRRLLPGVPASLAASSGIFLGPDYHADLVRPGAALYGIAPSGDLANPMRPVVGLQARVMQIRTVPAGTPVGYGHTMRVARESRLATVALGYADGFSRAACERAEAWFGDIRLPLTGRVSMDSIVLDATDVLQDAIRPGSFVDIIGPRRDVDAVARAAGTIGYEVLTNLGHRFHRVYLQS